MRIHSDVFRYSDFCKAITAAGLSAVAIEDFGIRGSRKRAIGFEVRLSATAGKDNNGKTRIARNSGHYGAENNEFIKAATYDEHGKWIAELYNIDPNAIVGPYKDSVDFHRKTDGRYADDLAKIL